MQNYYQKQKKPWVRPGIRVLVRSQNQEAVLFTCKNIDVGSGGPASNWGCGSPGHGHGQGSAFCFDAQTS